MAKQNAFLAQRTAERQAMLEIGVELGFQQAVDIVTCVLRDPQFVGKDVFGPARIRKLFDGLHHYKDAFDPAFDRRNPYADVVQRDMDSILREVWGEETIDFQHRYPMLKQIDYGGKNGRR